MIGRHLAHFQITAKLGEGGMGVVYEAVDRHLDRRTALKILRPDKVMDWVRKQRFIQEAKAASALNHPNVVTIYDINTADGVDYIAMELVHGVTLQALLAGRRLRLTELLKYAVQIADALAAAHAAGIVHRDLKPANVMITDRGSVKILDFGLAKLTDRSEPTENDETRTEFNVTEEGMVVGSAAYMSPEQAEGRKIDARSDIFSFGLLVYEMLSGKRAFRGDTRIATVSAILNQEPEPLRSMVPDLPKEVDRIIARCLRKDPARRAQNMADLKLALEELAEEMESATTQSMAPAASKYAGRRRWMSIGAAVLVVFVALFLLLPHWWETRTPMRAVPLTSYLGYQGDPTLSPDGNQFAFVWAGEQQQGGRQLYVCQVGQATPLRLTNLPMAEARYPAWSPDGQAIAFVRFGAKDLGDLMVIPALGGPLQKISESAARFASGTMRGPAWAPNGKWLYFTGRPGPGPYGVFVVPSAGGEERRLIDPPAGDYMVGDGNPSASPDGRQVVFVRSFADNNQDLFVADLRDGNTVTAVRQLTSDHQVKKSPVWTTDGKEIVYVAGEISGAIGIFRVPAAGGAPMRVEGISDYPASLAIALKGNRLAVGRQLADFNIWRMPLPPVPANNGSSAGVPSKFISTTRYEVSPVYSPDGKRIAFASNRGGLRQIWVVDADGSNAKALTSFPRGVAGSPKWSPDGQTIVFDARPEGAADIYTILADGGAPKRLTDHKGENHLPCYSADGRWIYFASTRSGERQLYRIPSSGGEIRQITSHGAFASAASPDGKWIYYSKGGQGIWKVPPDGGEETEVLEARRVFIYPFTFCVTRTGLYFAGPPRPGSQALTLKLHRFEDGKTLEIGHFDKLLQLGISVSPDEKWLLYTQLDLTLDDLMLVENFR